MKCLDDLYAKRIQSINDQFISHAREKNLPVLFEALNVTDEKHKEQLSREYYYFIVRKEHKNQGFSIRKIRELILLLPDAEKLTEQQYDRVHAKLYMLLDFVIFDWYRNHPKSATALVSNLRSAPTEEDKLRCYSKAIVPLWKDIKASVMGHIAEQLSASHVTKIPPVQIENDVLNPVWISQHASYFSELIYLLTCFQSGKETNDLLTTLVNKFESIASFLQVMKNQDLTCNFVREYQMFYDSRKIADELRIVNAIARMKTEADDDLIKSRMCACNAVRLLGFKGDEQTLIKFIDEMYDMMIPHHLSKNYSDYSFRNFIFCNVTGFKYFQYLLRYGDPEKLHKLARSKKAVAFVLKGIPNAQIAYYYNGSMGVNTSFNPNMREELQIIIANVNISDFKNVRTNEKFSTAKERAEKQQKKMIAHLYLTVLYLLVKNLVYVNSRYFMAFHCLERDASVYDLKKYRNSCNHKERLREFAMERVEQGMLNKRATCYMKQNFANSDPFFITKFRSAVEHLSVVRNADKYIDDIAHFNSYFELYHYLLQRSLIDSYRYDIEHGKITNESVNPALLKYMALVEKYHTYCKDMVKVLNVPFAYNLPRYKNLSINELFDRNNYLPDATSKDAVKSE